MTKATNQQESDNLRRARFDIESLTPMLLRGWADHPVHDNASTPDELFRRSIETFLAPESTKTTPKIQLRGVWFKMMLVDAVGDQTIKRRNIHNACIVMEDQVVLKHSPVKMRKDAIALPAHHRRILYRGQIDTWSCSFTVFYNRDYIDKRGLAALVEAGGITIGLGSGRAQKNGPFGQFQLKRVTARRLKAA